MELKFELATEPAVKATITVVACTSIAYVTTHTQNWLGSSPPQLSVSSVSSLAHTRHHPPLHWPHHRQQWAHVRPTGAQSNMPETSRATAGPTVIRSRLDTRVQPAPPGVWATIPEPPKPTQWAEVSTTWGTPFRYCALPLAPTRQCKTADHIAIDVEVVNSNLANYINGDISGCANPPNLNETALIDTAASCTLLTKAAPAAAMTNADIQITVIQPGGD
jgi:hypothetical protein